MRALVFFVGANLNLVELSASPSSRLILREASDEGRRGRARKGATKRLAALHLCAWVSREQQAVGMMPG